MQGWQMQDQVRILDPIRMAILDYIIADQGCSIEDVRSALPQIAHLISEIQDGIEYGAIINFQNHLFVRIPEEAQDA